MEKVQLNANANLEEVPRQHGTEQTDEKIQNKYGFSHQSIHGEGRRDRGDGA